MVCISRVLMMWANIVLMVCTIRVLMVCTNRVLVVCANRVLMVCANIVLIVCTIRDLMVKRMGSATRVTSRKQKTPTAASTAASRSPRRWVRNGRENGGGQPKEI